MIHKFSCKNVLVLFGMKVLFYLLYHFNIDNFSYNLYLLFNLNHIRDTKKRPPKFLAFWEFLPCNTFHLRQIFTMNNNIFDKNCHCPQVRHRSNRNNKVKFTSIDRMKPAGQTKISEKHRNNSL